MKTLAIELYLDQDAVEKLTPSELTQIEIRLNCLIQQIQQYTNELHELREQKWKNGKRSQGDLPSQERK